MNLKMSLWDSIIWLVKLGEHDDRMDLKWEDPELGTDARIKKWRTSKPSHSLALLQRLIKGTHFCPYHFHLHCAHVLNDIYLHNELLFSMLKPVCVFPDSLKSSFSSESPWNIREGIFQQMSIWELPTLQLRRHVLCFSSLQLLKCLSNAPRCRRPREFRTVQWVHNVERPEPHRRRPHTESSHSRKLKAWFPPDDWTSSCPRLLGITSQALAACAKEASKGAGTPVVFNRLFPAWILKVAILQLELASWGVTGVLIVDAVCFVYNFLLDKLHVSTDA